VHGQVGGQAHRREQSQQPHIFMHAHTVATSALVSDRALIYCRVCTGELEDKCPACNVCCCGAYLCARIHSCESSIFERSRPKPWLCVHVHGQIGGHVHHHNGCYCTSLQTHTHLLNPTSVCVGAQANWRTSALLRTNTTATQLSARTHKHPSP